MLRTTKNMKDKYEKIQSLIFSLIPERWEEIYLYASVVGSLTDVQNGEMFFYYIPKGILKKRAINVYEVPQRFNINEEQYLDVVKQLYDCIKELKQDFVDTEQELWTNVTISMVNSRFKVEFNYERLPMGDKESQKRHIIWRYKYLKIGGEKKEERIILDDYFSNRKKIRKEVYETDIYLRDGNNSVTFDKGDILRIPKEVVVYEKESVTDFSDIEEIEENNPPAEDEFDEDYDFIKNRDYANKPDYANRQKSVKKQDLSKKNHKKSDDDESENSGGSKNQILNM